MGCDIHTRCEVRHKNNGWVMAGEVFDYPYDWSTRTADETLFATLSDGQLLDTIDTFYTKMIEGPEVPDDPLGFSRTREFILDPEKVSVMSQDALDALKEFRARKAEFNRKLGEHRDRVMREGWDYYGKVRPVEMKLRRELYDSTRLDRGVRRELETPVLEFRYEWSDSDVVDYSDDDYKWSVSLNRAEGDPPFKTAEPYGERHYTLFAALADVRNGFGFGGVDLGDPIQPIDRPRGVPPDCSPEWREYVEGWGVDGHSHSWLTVKETLEWDGWDQQVVNRGVTDAESYEEFKRTGKLPDNISGSISGQGIVTVPWWEYDEHLRNRERGAYEMTMGGAFRAATDNDEFEDKPGTMSAQPLVDKPLWAESDDLRVHVKFQWTEILRDQIGESFFHTMEQMRQLGDPAFDGKDVRLVMLFDN